MPNFTRRAIQQSLMKLLADRPLNKITVKDIVEDCGINRNSFYYHFADLPALVESLVTEEADRLVEAYPSFDTIEEAFAAAIQFALANRKAVLHIYNSVNRDLFEQYLLRVCRHVVTAYMNTAFPKLSLSDNDRDAIVRYYVCGCFGIVLVWMSEGMTADILDSSRRLLNLRKAVVEDWLSQLNKQDI